MPSPLRLNVDPTLDEERVWREHVEPQLAGIPANALRVLHYCVTEMVNNIKDHSGAGSMLLGLRRTEDEVACHIHDDGIGIFRKLQSELGLEDPRHVALELAKGKLTTDPARHTGEGIFFSARMCDRFLLGSEDVVCGHVEDSPWLVDKDEFPSGTTILIAVKLTSPRTPEDVFDAHAPPDPDFGFTKTEIPANLLGDDLVSRSQAKRLLARCEHFKEVTLDFSGVKAMSPTFADEAFRVWPSQHPGVSVHHRGAAPALLERIERARRGG